MPRFLLALLAAVAATASASAHFVFVVPQPGGKAVRVVLSEDLEPDDGVTVEKLAGLKLTARSAGGTAAPVACTPEPHSLTAALPTVDTQAVYGSVTYGITARKGSKPALLVYHPKAVFAGAPEAAATLGAACPLEVVPVTADGKTRFKLLAAGNPVAGGEGSVLLPDDTKQKVKTDAAGFTPAFAAAGRYGVWLRHTEAKAGDHAGQKYEEVKHYATLVVDVALSPSPAVPPLPVGVSSLGAVACDGFVYVYGGHAGETHSYDTDAILGTFHRVSLAGGTAWEPLAGGPKLQGVNLAAHAGKVYRVGGMTARNAPGEPADTVSVRDCARFDPATGKWEDLPPLPAGRSSHDLVAAAGKLVVVGGWELRGKGNPPAWHDTALVMDPAATPLAWKPVPQPFSRRALTAAAVGDTVYAIAGLTDDGKPQPRVDIFDAATGAWSRGPDLPGAKTGFSPAAAVVAGVVVVSTSDGKLHRLAGGKWEPAGTTAGRRRVHRLVPAAGGVLLVGGAAAGGNATEVEYAAVAGGPAGK